ncbi:MerR family transcriptional regulator [Niastella caeni]|uniref:MerR family transcriptional regulator n=1 Tax=Niastella caeni TaxID=2569763 RepID=A0A4V4H0N1_9BACT|nr:MerR family transcriptional regulator [Niastella caeni]THU37206.1 MerR family transcriptional regulator [Niastella caeni]
MDNRNYSQITFEFSSDVPAEQENEASVGVRVKSLKTEAEPAKPEEAPKAVLTEPIESVAAVSTAPAKKSTRGRKSLKALDAEADLVNIPDDETLFQRQYYSIGEVADMFGVNQSLLRFWENEFDIIQPRKNRKGDRHFRPIDIKNLELIYDLLRRRKLTIEGAKDFLKKNSKAAAHFEMIQSLQSLKGFLLEIKAAL